MNILQYFSATPADTVFCGDIGSTTWLDFTVIDPAVSGASRILSLCRSILPSSDFVAATSEPEHSTLVSTGRFALRGSQAQDLCTIGPKLVQK